MADCDYVILFDIIEHVNVPEVSFDWLHDGMNRLHENTTHQTENRHSPETALIFDVLPCPTAKIVLVVILDFD